MSAAWAVTVTWACDRCGDTYTTHAYGGDCEATLDACRGLAVDDDWTVTPGRVLCPDHARTVLAPAWVEVIGQVDALQRGAHALLRTLKHFPDVEARGRAGFARAALEDLVDRLHEVQHGADGKVAA